MAVTIKGEQARALCREVIRQLGDLVPSGVTVAIHRNGKRCVVSSEGGPRPPRAIHPGDPEYDRFRRKSKSDAPADGEAIDLATVGSFSGTWAPGGFGAWIPFLPRSLAVKLAMIDVVETIQQVVTDAYGKPWPGEGFKVRAEQQDDSVRLWFQDANGRAVPAAMLRLDLAGG
jgi:hypothetical protein